MKKVASAWITLAEKDVNEKYLTNIVAFHCQQAIADT
jgi:hypothetical protein